MTANSSKDLSVWERLEQGRQAKADSGGYAGYGSPAFGQRSIDGELSEDPVESQTIELIRRHHKSGKSLQSIWSTLMYGVIENLQQTIKQLELERDNRSI